MTRAVSAAWAPLLLIAVGLAGVWSGMRYGVWEALSPGAGFVPALAGGALCVFGVVIVITEARATGPDTGAVEQASRWRLLGYLIGLLGFCLLMEPLGAITAIVLLFLWILSLVERLRWRLVLSVSTGASFGAWFLFDWLLKVPLPRGLFI